MFLYPNVPKRAQEELDRVVGPNRLPDFDDYSNHIYIQAIALECMRWMPVTPIVLPRSITRDDEYRGFFIPKGTTIIAVNITVVILLPTLICSLAESMDHVTQEDYPELERLNPDRFIADGKLNPHIRNPLSIALGFGHRCIHIKTLLQHND
ncbi:hypothetical protein QCA50_008855 [Cerrena zonata]|uniref:Cytochrome P450 n=1 Tax=Cerrena zonata TaxID=2478898 RepID=A0AAW0GF47_9APHY